MNNAQYTLPFSNAWVFLVCWCLESNWIVSGKLEFTGYIFDFKVASEQSRANAILSQDIPQYHVLSWKFGTIVVFSFLSSSFFFLKEISPCT